MTEDQKEQVMELVETKMSAFEQEIQTMVNNFQIEIIRQFEIQRTCSEKLIEEFLIGGEEDQNERMEAAEIQNEVMAFEPDLADGDDFVFFSKYGAVTGKGITGEDSDVDDDSFDNGYYF